METNSGRLNMAQKTSENRKRPKRAVVVHRPKKVLVSHDRSRGHRSFLSHSTLAQKHASCKKKVKALLSNNKALAQALEASQCEVNVQNKIIVELQRRLTSNLPQIVKLNLQTICEHLQSVVVLLQESMDFCDSQSASPSLLNEESCKMNTLDSPSELYIPPKKLSSVHPNSENCAKLQPNAKLNVRSNFCNMSAIIEQSGLAEDLTFPPILFTQDSDQGENASRRTLSKAKFLSKSKSINLRKESSGMIAIMQESNQLESPKEPMLTVINAEPEMSGPKENISDLHLNKMATSIPVEEEAAHYLQSEQKSTKKGIKCGQKGGMRSSRVKDNGNIESGLLLTESSAVVCTDAKKSLNNKIASTKTSLSQVIDHTNVEKTSNKSSATITSPSKSLVTTTPEYFSIISGPSQSTNPSSLKPIKKTKRNTFIISPKNIHIKQKKCEQKSFTVGGSEQETAHVTDFRRQTFVISGNAQEQVSKKHLQAIKPNFQTCENELSTRVAVSHQDAKLGNVSSNNKLADVPHQPYAENINEKPKNQENVSTCVQDLLHNVTFNMVDDMELTKPLGSILALQQDSLLSSASVSVPSEQMETPLVRPGPIPEAQFQFKEKKNSPDAVKKSNSSSMFLNSLKQTHNPADVEGNIETGLKCKSKKQSSTQQGNVNKEIKDKIHISMNKNSNIAVNSNTGNKINQEPFCKSKDDIKNNDQADPVNHLNANQINKENDTKTTQIAKKGKLRKTSKYRLECLSDSSDEKDADYYPTGRKRFSHLKMKSAGLVSDKKHLKSSQSKIPSICHNVKPGQKQVDEEKLCLSNPPSPSAGDQNAEKSCVSSLELPFKAILDLPPSEPAMGLLSPNEGDLKGPKNMDVGKLESCQASTKPNPTTEVCPKAKKMKSNEPIPVHLQSSTSQAVESDISGSPPNQRPTLTTSSQAKNSCKKKSPKMSSEKNSKKPCSSHQKKNKKLTDYNNENELDNEHINYSPKNRKEGRRKTKKLFSIESVHFNTPLKTKQKRRRQALTPKQQLTVAKDDSNSVNFENQKAPSEVPNDLFHANIGTNESLTCISPSNHEENRKGPQRRKSHSKLAVQDENKKISEIMLTASNETGEQHLKLTEENGEINPDVHTHERARKRRAAGLVSYREPSLNAKLRREDVNTLSNLLSLPQQQKKA